MSKESVWIDSFVETLGCTRCQTRNGARLYRHNKSLVEPNQYTVDKLNTLVPRMDVWCPRCAVTFTTRVMGPVRLQKKLMAAEVANQKIDQF